jgi:hypothetical protein
MGTEPRMRFPRSWQGVAGVAALLAAVGLALAAAKDGSPNVHREKAGTACVACHTADEGTLRSQASAQSPMLADDLDARCAACHDPLDASHRTGVLPKKPVPPALPLSGDGKVTCATCHFMHGENDAFGDFVRLDNRQGALCLTCHELADLQ